MYKYDEEHHSFWPLRLSKYYDSTVTIKCVGYVAYMQEKYMPTMFL